uniref:Uncharacterized protein n=1 Tax=Picea sitchensis TaxID=3332 RepID=A9NZC1_PICSI|nr:unknown [Picea sitchensis]
MLTVTRDSISLGKMRNSTQMGPAQALHFPVRKKKTTKRNYNLAM